MLVRDLLRAYHSYALMLYMHDAIMFDGLSNCIQGYTPVNLIVNYHDLTPSDADQ